MSSAIDMTALAVVLDQPKTLEVRRLALTPPSAADCVVDVDFSGVSTGTERLLWSGRMPPFPGMGYPLVPGYESVGKVVWAGDGSGRAVGEQVFVPGARCYGDVNGLFGGAASRVVIPGARLLSVPAALQADGRDEQAVLLALAATAYHAAHAPDGRLPELIVGHGVLGRLLARVAVAADAAPVVWETNPERAGGAEGYEVMDPEADRRQDYGAIYDVSGDGTLLDTLIGRLARGGEIVLAGFYEAPLSFNFPPAFMREMRLRVAAEFREPDLAAVRELIEAGRLSLDGLITHRREVVEAADAYVTAFNDPTCLKMVLDWRGANA